MKRRRKNPERPGDAALRLKAEKMHRQAIAEVRRGGWHYGMPGPRGVTFLLSYAPRIELTVRDDPKGTYAGRLHSFRQGTLKGPLEYEIILNVHSSRIRPDQFYGVALHAAYTRFTEGFANENPDFEALAGIVEAMRSTFIHEATHLLDSQRTNHAALGTGALPEDPRARMIAYYNSPAELNAYYQAFAAEIMRDWRLEIRDSIRESNDMHRMRGLRTLARQFQANFGSTADWFARYFLSRLRRAFGNTAYFNIRATSRARLRKRAAGFWESLRAMTRAEIERKRRESVP